MGAARRGSGEARPAGIAAPARAAEEAEEKGAGSPVVRLRSGRLPPSFPSRLPPPSERPLGRCDGPAGGGERAVNRRLLRDAPSKGERRGHGGKRSLPPFPPLPSLSPRPGGAAAASPRPSCPGGRQAANGGALPSAPASPPRPGPPRPPPFPRPLRRARPRAGPPGDPAQSPPPRQRGPVSRRR